MSNKINSKNGLDLKMLSIAKTIHGLDSPHVGFGDKNRVLLNSDKMVMKLGYEARAEFPISCNICFTSCRSFKKKHFCQV